MLPYYISLPLMLFLPLAAAIAFRRRSGAAWWLFVVGMVTFLGSQLYHLPLNGWLADLGLIGPVSADDPGFVRTALVLGLSAGLSESLARAAGYWLLFRRRLAQRWADGVMVGLGHGGIEAMGFISTIMAASLAALWGLRGTDLATLNLPADQLAQLSEQLAALDGAAWLAFLPLAERALAMTLHVVLSLLVWRAFERRNVLYWLTAVFYHSLFDATAVYLSQTVATGWVYLAFGILLLPGLLWLRAATRAPLPPPALPPLRAELRLFGVALRKELRQQWHTRRVLIVMAVFVLFGLGSPLLAKYTPQMLTMIEGAEQFADLIPQPTTADSLAQYVKNITQFGFLIAILLGMGAVAGEKERGTAALILSKPLPRWAFVLSKFTAQALVYAAAFAAAGLGAYYYTAILFEPFHFGAFLLGNGLLLLWLLTFTAVTLLGSTLGGSTSSAAGIALVGAIVLLLAGSIPPLAPFAPSSLIAGASQLGLPGAAAGFSASAAATVACTALIIALLVTAVAAIEGQEL
ncbi:MAG: YhfC family intramembrane metalloprotease [Anaerolineales bacterium]|nr:YhfC family intramembrane metalloprotease [Anaerolineales bacterium]